MPSVLNLRSLPPDTPYVRVDRGTKWGNPFVIGRDGTRRDVIRRYREYLAGNPYLTFCLSELRGQNLACWCAPLPCHADILLEAANR